MAPSRTTPPRKLVTGHNIPSSYNLIDWLPDSLSPGHFAMLLVVHRLIFGDAGTMAIADREQTLPHRTIKQTTVARKARIKPRHLRNLVASSAELGYLSVRRLGTTRKLDWTLEAGFFDELELGRLRSKEQRSTKAKAADLVKAAAEATGTTSDEESDRSSVPVMRHSVPVVPELSAGSTRNKPKGFKKEGIKNALAREDVSPSNPGHIETEGERQARIQERRRQQLDDVAPLVNAEKGARLCHAGSGLDWYDSSYAS